MARWTVRCASMVVFALAAAGARGQSIAVYQTTPDLLGDTLRAGHAALQRKGCGSGDGSADW